MTCRWREPDSNHQYRRERDGRGDEARRRPLWSGETTGASATAERAFWQERMAALGFGWAHVTAAQVYTGAMFDIHPQYDGSVDRKRKSFSVCSKCCFELLPQRSIEFSALARARRTAGMSGR